MKTELSLEEREEIAKKIIFDEIPIFDKLKLKLVSNITFDDGFNNEQEKGKRIICLYHDSEMVGFVVVKVESSGNINITNLQGRKNKNIIEGFRIPWAHILIRFLISRSKDMGLNLMMLDYRENLKLKIRNIRAHFNNFIDLSSINSEEIINFVQNVTRGMSTQFAYRSINYIKRGSDDGYRHRAEQVVNIIVSRANSTIGFLDVINGRYFDKKGHLDVKSKGYKEFVLGVGIGSLDNLKRRKYGLTHSLVRHVK